MDVSVRQACRCSASLVRVLVILFGSLLAALFQMSGCASGTDAQNAIKIAVRVVDPDYCHVYLEANRFGIDRALAGPGDQSGRSEVMSRMPELRPPLDRKWRLTEADRAKIREVLAGCKIVREVPGSDCNFNFDMRIESECDEFLYLDFGEQYHGEALMRLPGQKYFRITNGELLKRTINSVIRALEADDGGVAGAIKNQ